jgi:Lrp/AsnC family transcriptional regulator for asnA, asnC and gidA
VVERQEIASVTRPESRYLLRYSSKAERWTNQDANRRCGYGIDKQTPDTYDGVRQKACKTPRSVELMDDLDHKMINLLQMDGRASNAKIAREVGVSEGTVRRRLRRLVEDDVVKVIAVPNLEKLGYNTTALIGIQTSPGRSDFVANAIAQLPEAQYVAITTGAYDIFVWTGLPSAEALGDFLREKIGPIAGVQRTETFVNLAIKKRTYGLVL